MIAGAPKATTSASTVSPAYSAKPVKPTGSGSYDLIVAAFGMAGRAERARQLAARRHPTRHGTIHLVMSTEASQAAETAERAPGSPLDAAALRAAPQDARARSIDLRPLKTLLDRIEENYHPEQIWLFGSRARGDARPTSDWDVFVVVPDGTDEHALDPRVAWRLQRGSGVYADVIPCRASEFIDDRATVNTLAYIVASEGVLIYER